MTSRDGRQIIERVLEHLNYERVMDRDPRYTFAWLEASEVCCELIRNWHRPESFFNRRSQASAIARKAAA